MLSDQDIAAIRSAAMKKLQYIQTLNDQNDIQYLQNSIANAIIEAINEYDRQRYS